jgi:rubrerythrin
LKEAFAGESQANRKYLAFAAKADEEGLPQVARLFRAAAEAETETESKENLSWEIRKNNIQQRILEGDDESQSTSKTRVWALRGLFQEERQI